MDRYCCEMNNLNKKNIRKINKKYIFWSFIESWLFDDEKERNHRYVMKSFTTLNSQESRGPIGKRAFSENK